MSLKFKPQSATFKFPVKFNAVDESGEQKKIQFTGIFSRKKRSELSTIWGDKPKQKKVSDEVDNSAEAYQEALEKDADWVMRYMTGWDQVEINGSTDFNRDNLLLLLDEYPAMTTACFDAFAEGNSGGIAKN